MTAITIESLKKHLGPGLGLRKNRYLLEIPVPGIEGEKINVLCRSAGLPERNIATTNIFHKGRKYNLRGETDYIGTYEVSIIDDSSMNIRRLMDKWANAVDDSKPENFGIFSGASYEEGVGTVIDNIRAGVAVGNQVQNLLDNPGETVSDFFVGLVDDGKAAPTAKYQTDINVWQLSGSNDKIYGYKLQNAFPTSIGIVTLDDGDENTLSEFSVNFTFSEFLPLTGLSPEQNIVDSLLGDAAVDTLSGIESLIS